MNFIIENWTEVDYNNLINYLKEISDQKYCEFNKKITPGVNNMIGVRIPKLRYIAKNIASGSYKSYFKLCGQKYFEEIMLEGLVIGIIKTNYEDFIYLVDKYLNKINNWAVCDTFCSSLKLVKKYSNQFMAEVNRYLNSDNPWHIRFGMVILINYYINEQNIEISLKKCDSINCEHYYVKMAQAWLISIAYIKFPDITHNYLLKSELDRWTYNKAIQKICESYRVAEDKKQILKKMKR